LLSAVLRRKNKLNLGIDSFNAQLKKAKSRRQRRGDRAASIQVRVALFDGTIVPIAFKNALSRNHQRSAMGCVNVHIETTHIKLYFPMLVIERLPPQFDNSIASN
jgi:hypothetical protein